MDAATLVQARALGVQNLSAVVDEDLAVATWVRSLADSKLANEAFTVNAPAEVVEKTRAHRNEADATIARLTKQLVALPS